MSLNTAIEKAKQKIEYLSSDEEAMKIYYRGKDYFMKELI